MRIDDVSIWIDKYCYLKNSKRLKNRKGLIVVNLKHKKIFGIFAVATQQKWKKKISVKRYCIFIYNSF